MWILKLRRLAKTIGREALILAFAVRDPATPLPLKLAAVAALAYVISPIDLVPDLPLIGWVDDLLVATLGVPFLLRRLPPAVYVRAAARAGRLLDSLGGIRRARPAKVEPAAPTGRGTARSRTARATDARILAEHPRGERGRAAGSKRTPDARGDE